MSGTTGGNEPKRVLFAGYAPVHFICFLPIYLNLAADPRVELWLSGGFAGEGDDGTTYDIEGFYDPYPVNHDRVLPWAEAREREFDVVVCAHTSSALFPRRVSRKVQIFHGVSFKNFAVREKVLVYDLLCLPGRYHAERFRERGLVRDGAARCLITGFAKTDRLVEPGFDRADFLRGVGVDPARPTVLFAPTGNKYNALETVGREVIAAIAASGEWNLLIKPHDHPKRGVDWLGELADMRRGVVRLVRELDVTNYLRAADLLLTDASSVAVEFTLLDRPIVFVDVPKLMVNVLKKGAPLDLETYGRKIGLLARTAAEVVPAIRQALAEPDAQGDLRRKMARHVFHDPGRAAERVTAVIRHAAGLVAKLPEEVEVLQP